MERSTFVVSYLGYHTVGFDVWWLDSSRLWEKGLTAAWGNTAKSVVFEARRGVWPATLEHPFHSGVSLLLETATGDKTGWADSSKGPVCQRPRRGQGRSVGLFCASHFNSCFHSSQQRNTVDSKELSPSGVISERFWALLYHLAGNFFFFPPSLYRTDKFSVQLF